MIKFITGLPKAGLAAAVLFAVAGSTVFATSLKHRSFPQKQKIDLLVFQDGKTFEGLIVKEDAQDYYLQVPGGTTNFSKESVQLVKHGVYETATQSPQRTDSFSDFFKKIQKKIPSKKKNEFLQKRLQWEKAQAVIARSPSMPTALSMAQLSRARAAANSDHVSGMMDNWRVSGNSNGDSEERTHFGPPCPYEKN